jgi:hypothetical protein
MINLLHFLNLLMSITDPKLLAVKVVPVPDFLALFGAGLPSCPSCCFGGSIMKTNGFALATWSIEVMVWWDRASFTCRIG